MGAHVDGLLTWVPGCPIPQTLNSQYKQISAQPVESAGKDRPARAESTRDPGTITKTAIVPMTPEGAGSQKGLRFQTHSCLMQRGAHHPDHTTSWIKSHGSKPPEQCNSAPCKGPIRDENAVVGSNKRDMAPSRARRPRLVEGAAAEASSEQQGVFRVTDILQATRPGTGRKAGTVMCAGGGAPEAGREAASDGEVYEETTIERLPAEVCTVACLEYDDPVPCNGRGVALLYVGTT